MSEHIKIGLIGCGTIAELAHANLYADLGYDLAACYNPTQHKAESIKARFGTDETQVCSSIEALLAIDALDCVCIATPPDTHIDIILAALQAGKHVLCEKPLVLSSADCERITAAEDSSGKSLCCFSSRLRYGGYTNYVKEIIEAGTLGEIYRIEVKFSRQKYRPGVDVFKDAAWFRNQEQAGGGILFDMGHYFLDQILHMFNWPSIESVDGFTFQGFDHDLAAEQTFDVEEHGQVFIRLGTQITLTLDLSAHTHDEAVHTITILGNQGGLRIDHSNDKHALNIMQEAQGKKGQLVETNTHWQAAPWNSEEIYRGFASFIRGESALPGSKTEECRIITSICEQAYQSARALA